MAEICVRCGISEEKARLFDAIYDGRAEVICARCSIIENIAIIREPNPEKVKESERGSRVYERMKNLAGIKDAGSTINQDRVNRLRQIEQNPFLEVPERDKLRLIDYFHWEIMRSRRRKGLSQRQLAEAIGESEEAIEMLEKAKIPENGEVIVRKIEHVLGINLRKLTELEKMQLQQQKKEVKKGPVLLDENGKELEIIPEPELVEEKEIDEKELKKEQEKESLRAKLQNFFNKKKIQQEDEEIEKIEDLELRNIDSRSVSIGDLRDMHKKKIEVTRQEKIEEQKKIEERQRLIEARKEELRLMKEKQSKELDGLLGGTELLKKDKKGFWD